MFNKLIPKKLGLKENKIIFIIPSLSAGGAEKVISQIASYWEQEGKNVSIIEISPKAGKISFEISKNIRIIRLFNKKDLKSFIFFKTFIRLFLKIKHENPRYVISFMTPVNILSIAVCKLLRIKCIVSERTSPSYSYGKRYEILRFLLYRFAYRIVVQTEENKNILRSRFAGQYSVIPNFIDLKKIKYNRVKRLKRIITVGRLCKEKRHDLTIKAFSKISHLIPDWDFWILGSGSENKSLNKLIKEKNLSHRIFLKGNVKNVFKYLNESSIGILISSFEGFPNALLEKLAMGLPVIASKEAGYMIIKNNYNGILLESTDTESIGEKIKELISNKKAQAKFSNNAKETVNKYKIEDIIFMWDNLLN